MEKTSYSYKIESHPKKTLFLHLKNVRDLMLQVLNVKVLNEKINKNELTELIKIIALTHDFGKSTVFFQDYINNKIKKSHKTNHSEISSLYSFYLAKKLKINKAYLPFVLTKSHHGSINVKELIKQEIYEEQLENIDFEELNNLYQELLEINVDFNEFKELIFDENSDLYYDLECNIFNLIYQQNELKDFFLTLFLFSLLIDSDKLDAGINNQDKIIEIKNKIRNFNHPDLVGKHKKTFAFEDSNKNSNINQIRESIYNEAMSKEINLENKIYSINVPTGTGKTLTSLSFACKLKDKLIKDKGFNPKIIYCLPFTSIIDQNYSVIEEILKNNGIEITTNILLKHHHLSDISYTTDSEEEEFDTNKSLLLIENWMSSIIVTTFVQFFHSFISNRNKSLKKFHNIANSIVILDEIQSIPHKYWTLINETLKTFSEMFNTYFILVTATQPLIFKPDEIIHIIKNRQEYFENPELNRIKLINETDKITTLEEFKPIILKDIKENPDKSFLIILNTIKSSQDVYSFLKKEIDSENTEILYLSTTILPLERQGIIEKVKKKEKRIVLVSTQVVEAGVDIDLDFVYRDLAPLDCIFQSAGRCNRHGNKDKGIVKIFNLIDEKNNKQFASYIYQPILLESTKSILSPKKEFQEAEFFKLGEAYYRSVYDKKSDDDSKRILNSMKTLDFSGIKEFQLIEEKVKAFDFFIEIDEEAVKIRKEFESILKNNEYENKFDKNNDLLEKRRELHKYMVSVRLKKGQEYEFETSTHFKFKGNPYYIPIEDVKDYYEKGGIGFYIKENEFMIL
ncbi:MAG: CRISPR-associated helicase Cas3' [bacterium]